MAKRRNTTQKYVSKGLHSNVSKDTLKAMKRLTGAGNKIINQLNAFRAGKNVVVTIPNPNQKETNKRFIKVPANTVWK